MKTYEDFEQAINFGKEHLPAVRFYDLAKLVGISESHLMKVILANKNCFSVNPETRAIEMKKGNKVEFLSTTESLEWFVKNCCDGDRNKADPVYTQKAIAASISAPISWEKGDFGFAIKVSLDGSHEGIGAKEKVSSNKVFGPAAAARVERLGRVGSAGSNTDKWLFGIILKPEEIASRTFGTQKLFYHQWVEEEANADKDRVWVWPAECEIPVPVGLSWEKAEVKPEAESGGKRKNSKKDKETPPADVPGQQFLDGTNPKPVETAPPASIIKPPPPPIVPPPPIASATAETLKQEIRSRAVGDAVAAGTVPPSPPAISAPPPISTPSPTVPSIGEMVAKIPGQTILQTQAATQVQEPVSVVAQPAKQAIDLLDSLLNKTGQK